MRKKKKAAKLPSENYTIFHALFEAARNKEKERNKSTSILHRLKLRK